MYIYIVIARLVLFCILSNHGTWLLLIYVLVCLKSVFPWVYTTLCIHGDGSFS